jgi:hypothetical protein
MVRASQPARGDFTHLVFLEEDAYIDYSSDEEVKQDNSKNQTNADPYAGALHISCPLIREA